MSITTIQDPYLVDALGYALNHQPCVIACSTLRAQDMAHQYLLASKRTVGYLRGRMTGETKHEIIEAFERGETDYLVTTTQVLYMGGYRFVREGVCIASSEHLTEPMYIQIAGRIGSPAPNSNRLFLKGVQ